MSPEHGPYLEFRCETQWSEHQLTPDAAGHDQLFGGNVISTFQGHASTVGIEVGHRAVLNQLMSRVAGRADPVSNHFVAAHCTSGRLKQSREIALGFQGKTGCDLIGTEGFVGDALFVHDPAGPWNRTFDCFFVPAFAVKEQSMGLAQLFSCVDLFLTPEPVRFLRQPAEHGIGIHLPEHSGFAKTAGFGVCQGLCLKQHHVGDAATGQGRGTAETSHATANNHHCSFGRKRHRAHAASPKLSPIGSVSRSAVTSTSAAPTERP